MTVAGVDISQDLLAAGCIALLIAAQCFRNALWAKGHAWFGRKADALQPALIHPAKA